MTDTRIERDSMGELAVPATALYGAQTQRAVNNFPVSGQRMPQAFVRALLLAKAAAARANVSLQQLDAPMGEAIAGPACNCCRRTSCSISRWMCSRPAPAPVPT